MGRPPSNGGPSFRFNQAEIAEMEAILQAHKTAMPVREVLVSLAEKFSNSEERSGKIEVQMKQVWNWFQNRRYAIRAKAAKSPGKLNITQMTQDDSAMVKGVPQATQPHGASSVTARTFPQAPQHPTGPSAVVRSFQQAPQHPAAFSGRVTDNSQMEYEAKSARDGAWYDVSTFLSHRGLETGDPEVLVRFAGFGAEEDEWVLVRKNVRQRSLPCESSECVAVLPADLILCFQEGKEQALYFDAHVLDAQRRRHDVRGCRCRFLVRYDHDQSEEIVALRKICRRPETDYRLQQLHAVNESLSANQSKNDANNIHTVSTLRVYPPAEVQQKQHKVEPVVSSLSAQVPQKRQKADSTFPPPPPDGSQKHFKVEPAMVAVPQNQPRVQPAPLPQPAAPLYPNKVEPVVPCPTAQPSLEPNKVEPVVSCASAQPSLEPNKVEPAVPCPSAQPSLEPHKVEPVVSCPAAQPLLEPNAVEPVVPVPSAQDSAETQVAIVPTCSEKVPLELHQVQPAMHGPSTESSPSVVAPAVAEPLKESMVSEVPSESHKVVAEPLKESIVSEVPSESHTVVAESLKESIASEVPSESHTVVAESLKESIASEVPSESHTVVAESLKESIASEVPSESHTVVAEPLKESIASEVPSESHKVVAEPLKESIVSEVPSESHKVVAEPRKESMVSESESHIVAEPPKESMVSESESHIVAEPLKDSIMSESESHKVEPTDDVSVAAQMDTEITEPQKEEPVVAGMSVEVPSEVHEVQPMLTEASVVVPPLEPKVAEPQKEELMDSAEVPSELHEVQPMSEVSVTVPPLEPKVAEPQKEELMVSEVPSQLHEVQPMIPGLLTKEVSVEPKIVEPQKDPIAPAVAPVEANVARPENQEPAVSVEVPLELHKVQPNEADTSVLKAIETKPKESVTTVEETETKTEEPANIGNVIEEPKLADDVMEDNVDDDDDDEHAKDTENANVNEVGNPELGMENVGDIADTVEMEEG